MPPQRILVPLDLTAPGEAKLPVAQEYALAFGAGLLLLHVLPARPVAALAERLPLRRDDHAGDVSPEEARARTYLDAIATRLRGAGVEARTLVRTGPVAATILAVAREEAVELIVIGSDIRGPLSQRFLGSIAGSIVAGAPCPVLLIKPEPAAPTPPQAVRSFTDDATRAGLLAPRNLGQRTIDVPRIIGSVGRAAELGTNFRPLRPKRAEQQRFDRVLQAGTAGSGWSPIDVYKLGYGYYVLDGHRRVAAAKELGQTEIEANVTEFVATDDAQAQRLFTTRRTFERRTGLTRVGAAVPETYHRLEEAIADHAAARGIADPREAAEDWHRTVFRPLIRRIRTLRLNRHFPGERSADIFARVAEHRRAVAAREGRAPDWPAALASFAADPRGNAAEDAARAAEGGGRKVEGGGETVEGGGRKAEG